MNILPPKKCKKANALTAALSLHKGTLLERCRRSRRHIDSLFVVFVPEMVKQPDIFYEGQKIEKEILIERENSN